GAGVGEGVGQGSGLREGGVGGARGVEVELVRVVDRVVDGELDLVTADELDPPEVDRCSAPGLLGLEHNCRSPRDGVRWRRRGGGSLCLPCDRCRDRGSCRENRAGCDQQKNPGGRDKLGREAEPTGGVRMSMRTYRYLCENQHDRNCTCLTRASQ